MSASVTAATTMTSRTASAVRTLDLTKTYGSGTTLVRALRSVTLDIPSGRFTAIMGASGSGKSTLLHCITGLDSPTSGRVWIGDTEITHLDDDALTKLRRQHVGFVFQSFNLMPTLSAADNITLPLRLSHTKVDKEWFDHITGMLGITERLGHKPSQMSGGQQQRVAVARALVTAPTSSSPTSRPAPSIRRPATICSPSCATVSTILVRPSSWSPMITTPLPGPTTSSP